MYEQLKMYHGINFDFEKNKTVLRGLRKQDWRDMQDLAANCTTKTAIIGCFFHLHH